MLATKCTGVFTQTSSNYCSNYIEHLFTKPYSLHRCAGPVKMPIIPPRGHFWTPTPTEHFRPYNPPAPAQ